MTQLTLNNRTAMVTGESAFYANFDRHSNLFNVPRNSPQSEVALKEAS